MTQLSISDDDLCASCAHLEYDPGNVSYCTKQHYDGTWPCQWDANFYAISCKEYKECEPGSNLVEA